MKHLALTVVAFLASALPGMAQDSYHDTLINTMKIDMANQIIAIIMIFGLPTFIVGLLLYFSYKNKQTKYKLASEALAAGKEIPQDLFKGNVKKENSETLTKGIKNIFLGIGLGVFLWILTEEAGIVAIGFLIFCNGLGQVVIAYATRPKENGTHTEHTSNTDIEKL